MGFNDDIMNIVRHLPLNRQTILFSATMPHSIQELANNILNEPVEIKIAISKPADNINQFKFICHEGMKDKVLINTLCNSSNDRIIMFVSQKSKVKELASTLKISKLIIGAMHSDLSQKERDTIMYEFRNHRINLLIATDIVSRGIDIDDIQLVINYDVPHDAEDYVHRIGRTARANRTGNAITIVSPSESIYIRKIEELIGFPIPELPLPDGCGVRPSLTSNKSKRQSSNKHRHASNNRHRKQQCKSRSVSTSES